MQDDATGSETPAASGRERKARRCLGIGFVASLVLFGAKLIGGIVGGSQALLADAFHSALDIVSGVVAYLGYRLSLRPPDKSHPYGHHNADAIAALVVGFVILTTGVTIVHGAIVSILDPGGRPVPEALAAWIAVGAIVLKFVLYFYARAVAEQTRSLAVIASREDHFAEVFATGGALIGIVLARMVWPPLDAVAALWVAAVILLSAVRILRQNVHILMGGEPDDETRFAIHKCLKSTEGVHGLHRTKIRMQGSKYVVKAEILVDPELSVERAHDISTLASRELMAQHTDVAEVVLHIEPDSEHRRRDGPDTASR